MWGSRRARDAVTCIACGDSVPRAEAREYDKHGDRWDRRDKEFEYLCKPCHRGITHYSREGLEATLREAEVETDADSQAAFLRRYLELIEERESAE
jgi:hypothetical protein